MLPQMFKLIQFTSFNLGRLVLLTIEFRHAIKMLPMCLILVLVASDWFWFLFNNAAMLRHLKRSHIMLLLLSLNNWLICLLCCIDHQSKLHNFACAQRLPVQNRRKTHITPQLLQEYLRILFQQFLSLLKSYVFLTDTCTDCFPN